MANILMVNLPFAGHVHPTLPLAHELVNAGHAVSYINGPEWKAKIQATEASFIPYLDYPPGLSDWETKRKCFVAAYKTVMAVGKEYDLLIYEMLFFPGKTVAERLGIPCVRQFSTTAWSAATIQNVANRRSWALSCYLIAKQLFGAGTQRAMGMVGKSFVDSVVGDVPDLNIVYLTDLFQPYREAFDERFVFVDRTFTPPREDAASYPYHEMKRPIICISMGSMISSKGFCKKCVSAFGNKEASVILSTGKIAPESLGRLPDNIHARPFIPQTEVLRHADLFITHGGMNSVNEAMYFGVPMLVLPFLNDQPTNAEQVRHLGIGRRARIFPLSADALYSEAMQVWRDSAVKDNAARVQKHIREGIGAREAAALIAGMLVK